LGGECNLVARDFLFEIGRGGKRPGNEVEEIAQN